MRYVALHHSRIRIVSDSLFTHPNFTVLPLPKEVTASPKELMEEWVYQNEFYKKNSFRPLKELKIAIVSNFRQKCGIATYLENLLPSLAPHCKDFKLFVEHNDSPTGSFYQVGNFILRDDQVIPCWKRGESMMNLAQQIKGYQPDIVLVNHEHGIFPRGDHWISLMTQLSEFRVIVIEHSVFKHRDKTIVEAAMPEIIVHLSSGKEWLEEKGITNPIHVIPHGCYDLCEKPKLWNYYKTPHTMLTTGFGHPYKGFEILIDSVKILKETYSDVFLTILFSEDKKNSGYHDSYYFSLIDKISELKLEENVGIIRGFQTEEVLESFYLTNQVAAFCYQSSPGHEVSGSSGMSRFALKFPIPVITSTIPHFEDLPTLKASTAVEMAAMVSTLFASEEAKAKQIKIQQTFVKENSWAKIAELYKKVIENEA